MVATMEPRKAWRAHRPLGDDDETDSRLPSKTDVVCQRNGRQVVLSIADLSEKEFWDLFMEK